MITATRFAQTFAVLLSGATLAASVACAPENPRLMSPPVKYEVAETEAKPIVLNISPKVDVLMVIDNSASMVDEQETLSKNIDRFANSIAKNGNIDFHIGVVSVWDTAMFKDMQKDYGKGELRHLKTPDGKEKLPDTFSRYVDSKANYDEFLASKGIDTKSTPGWLQVLRSSMKIGVEGYNPKHAEEHTGGPENEEVFSPVQAALDSSSPAAAANKGFRRKDAHLVIVFITDTDGGLRNPDGSMYDLSPGELEDFLQSNGQAGDNYRDDVSVIGVLAKASDPIKELDPALRGKDGKGIDPSNLVSFVTSMGGKRMGLRGKSYGDEMAQLGDYVRSRALTHPRVDIERAIEPSTLDVTLNGEKLVKGESFNYDDSRNGIMITRDLSGVKGALDIKVAYTPLLASSVTAGRIKLPGSH